MSEKSRVIKEYPLISVHGNNLYPLAEAEIDKLTVGSGEITFHPENWKFNPQRLGVAYLATLGLTNQRIGEEVGLTEASVKGYMENIMEDVWTRSRSGLSRALFDMEVYRVTRANQKIGLRDSEKRFMTTLSMGATIKQASFENDITPNTGRTRVREIGGRTGWKGQEEIILASFVSGEIGEYAVKALAAQFPPTEPTSDIANQHLLS